MPFFDENDDHWYQKLGTILLYIGIAVVAFGVNWWSGFLDY